MAEASPAAAVDIAARLADRVGAIELDRVALADVIELLRQLSTLPITMDAEGLLDAGVDAADKVSVHLTDTTVGEILEAVLAERGLAYVVVDSQIVVTSSYRQQRTFEISTHPIADLVSDAEQAGALAQLVERLVEPTSWKSAGGEGSIEVSEGSLRLRQTRAAERQVSALLNRLRVARGLGGASGRAAAGRRLASAKARLAVRTTATFTEETPLGEVVEHLASAAGVNVLFDGLALAEIGLSGQTAVKLAVADVTLEEAFAALLEPMDLAIGIVDERTLQITTRAVLNNRLELELYRIGELVEQGTAPDALIDRILGEVAGKSWETAGGGAVIEYDRASECLLVLQCQPAHAQIELLLARLREGK